MTEPTPAAPDPRGAEPQAAYGRYEFADEWHAVTGPHSRGLCRAGAPHGGWRDYTSRVPIWQRCHGCLVREMQARVLLRVARNGGPDAAP